MGQRLGSNTRPSNYRIEITTDFSSFTFLGSESVTLELDMPSRSVTMNALELEIRGAQVEYKGRAQKAFVSLNEKDGEVTFGFREKIGSGAVLHIDFKGRNGDGMYGLYRSRYRNGKGKDAYVLSSHMEPAHARTVFPCFDEPSFKATFELSVVTDSDLETISNMPISSTRSMGSKKRVAFMRTPRMSSYLLYIGVGRFEHASSSYRGRPLRAFAVHGKAGGCGKALEFAKAFLAYYEGYFGIRYPLPKLDLIAVPDFAAGAMENWGAITFREQDMLYTKSTSTRIRTRIAEVVAHELAHQWFGDLVTMKWWDDTWLNESFAEFMSYKAIESVFPEWRRALDFFYEEVDGAFSVDGFKSTHPIYSKIASVGDIDIMFDDVSYLKGASALAMLEGFMGKGAFRRGLHSYLKEHELSNADKEDLWGSLERACGKGGVKQLVTRWIMQPGYPVLRVGNGEITQERFVMRKGERLEGLWPVPIRYLSGNGREGSLLMKGRRCAAPGSKSAWTKLNHGQSGLYRVFYGKGELEQLSEAVRRGRLGDVDAWGLVEDIYIMARTGRMKVLDFLSYMGSFQRCGYPADVNVLDSMMEIYWLFHGSRLGENIRKSVDDYSSMVLKKIGWRPRKGEQDNVKRMRSKAILASGLCENPRTAARCRGLFDSSHGGKAIDKEIRRSVYGVVSFNYGNMFPRLRSIYRKTASQEERMDLLAAMALGRTRKAIGSALAFALSKEVRPQDSYAVVTVMSRNPAAQEALWKWTRSNWGVLKRRYAPGTLMLGEFVSSLSRAKTEGHRIEISLFFSKKGNMREDIELNVGKTLEMIGVNIDCLQFNSG